MLTIKYESTFKKDFKRIIKRGYDIRLLEAVIELWPAGKRCPNDTGTTG